MSIQEKGVDDTEKKGTSATTIIENIDDTENKSDSKKNGEISSNLNKNDKKSFDETLKVPGTNLEPDLEEMKMDDVDIDKVDSFSLNAVRL